MKMAIKEKIDEIYNLVNNYLISNKYFSTAEGSINTKYLVMKSFCETRLDKLKNEIESQEYITEDSYFSYSILSQLKKIYGEFEILINKLNSIFSLEFFSEMVNIAAKVNDISKEINIINLAVDRANTLVQPAIEQALEDIRGKVGQMDNVLLAIETNKTDEIYKNAEKRFGDKARKYEKAFYITLLITIGLFVLSLFFPVLDNNSPIFEYVKYVLSKLVIITLSITLCTVFSRKGAHFRKLQDQAYQTHLELNAFPLHTNRLPAEDKNVLIKELALKYFGKEVDQSQNDKIGDLMKDQLTAGTELIKVSAELVKNAKTISTSVDKTKITKPNNTSAEDKTKSEGDG